jgi:rhodanese-related sulfurtransferase
MELHDAAQAWARGHRDLVQVKPIARVRSVSPREAWDAVQRGDARVLDLRSAAERRRYGWPPGAPRVSLARHIAAPGGSETIYLCQHANRSKLTGRHGAAEVAGGWVAWERAGLPIERGWPRRS